MKDIEAYKRELVFVKQQIKDLQITKRQLTDLIAAYDLKQELKL